MTISSAASRHYGYGFAGSQNDPAAPARAESSEIRQTYGTTLLDKLDDRAYQAFKNATAGYGESDKAMFANALEKTVARNAANQYALVHDVEKAHDVEVVYAFFDAYHDVVSTDEIKHLLNTKLQTAGHPPYDQEKIESFFNDYQAQLGGSRRLDIVV